ncbi:MAG: hypothetical protein HPY50_02355 [Firmicutes bacterium]|nr:hypothetical protein [Bacillota bacterium]
MSRKLLILVGFLAVFALFPRAAPAATWDYTIKNADTATTIDVSGTNAVVDTDTNEIRLPKASPHAVSFYPDGSPDFVVTTPTKVIHYALDIATNTYKEVGVLEINPPSNPLGVVGVSPYPDVVVSTQTGTYHYSFAASMVQNPALSVAGLQGCMSIGARDMDVAGLVGNSVEAYSFQAGAMARAASLEPSAALNNPVDIILYSDRKGMAVAENDRVRVFLYNGSSSPEATFLNITGQNGIIALGAAEDMRTAFISGSSVYEWQLDAASGTMKDVPVLAVTSGLKAPSLVALRPNSYDRIIGDGDTLRYYKWNSSSGQLEYNASLSVAVAGLSNLGRYIPSATALSLPFDPGADTPYVRVRASIDAPTNTSITFSVTADSTTWATTWRVRGTAGGTVCETTTDNGTTWTSIGDRSQVLPTFENNQIWVTLPAGRSVRWKAVLATSDPEATPRIVTVPAGGVAVRIDTDAAPNVPIMPTYSSCFSVASPALEWTFSDPDPGDYQTAYQVQVVKTDMALLYDTDWVTSSDEECIVPSSSAPDTPSLLWDSGDYNFNYRVRCKDRLGLESSWSNYVSFCVIAFDRPRIAEIVSPPAQTFLAGTEPVLNLPTTHIVITPGMTSTALPPVGLPRIKAGAKATLLVDSIGPVSSVSSAFPYLTTTSTVWNQEQIATNGVNGRWQFEFSTDANLDVCPSGTVVGMDLEGNGASGATELHTPDYSDGVAVTSGSIYTDWVVALKGRSL